MALGKYIIKKKQLIYYDEYLNRECWNEIGKKDDNNE